jgi:hypothetical protein
MLASEPLAVRGVLELAAIISEPAPLPPEVGDIFTRRLEHAHYLALLQTWENTWDRVQLIEMFEAIYHDVINLRMFLVEVLAKLDADTGVANSDYTSTIPVRKQTFLK